VVEATEKAIAALARRQRGCVTRAQLLALGLSAGSIERRVRLGVLILVYRGVYAVGHLPVTPEDRAAAAVLACGCQAALSHGSALSLWGWGRPLSAPFHVAAPSKHRRPGIVLHRSTALTRAEVRIHLGIRVTGPARTMLDVAPELSERDLRRAVREARLSRRLHDGQLAEVVARFPRHPGAKLIAPLIAVRHAPTRSEFEDAFLAFCERFGLPRPQVNVRVNGHLVDAFFDRERLIVELDGYEFHRDRETFEGDRDRDTDNLVVDLATVRATWPRITATPQKEADRLHRILEARRRQ
jgi:very-short-patch-repair endonuclease